MYKHFLVGELSHIFHLSFIITVIFFFLEKEAQNGEVICPRSNIQKVAISNTNLKLLIANHKFFYKCWLLLYLIGKDLGKKQICFLTTINFYD